jgi:hypothetical protein
MWVEKAQGIKLTPPSFPHFSISSNLFTSSCSSVSKTLLSIYRIKHAHETRLLIVKPLNTYHKALDSRGGDFSRRAEWDSGYRIARAPLAERAIIVADDITAPNKTAILPTALILDSSCIFPAKTQPTTNPATNIDTMAAELSP